MRPGSFLFSLNIMNLAVKEFLDPALRASLDQLDRLIGPLHLVGGVVRDGLMGRALTNDLDLVVALPIRECYQKLSQVGGLSVSWGPGGLNLLISLKRMENPRTIEISSFRHRPDHPPSVGEDLLNRDITINALAYRWPDGPLVDPWGGLSDLSVPHVRLVNGQATLQADPLRALRFFRFTLQLQGQAVEEDLAFSSETALKYTACERVRNELDRIFSLPLQDPASRTLIHHLFGSRLGLSILPELADLRDHPAWRQTMDMVLAVTAPEEPDVSLIDLRWAALLHRIGLSAAIRRQHANPEAVLCEAPLHAEENMRQVEDILLRLDFSKRRQRRILTLIHHLNLGLNPTERALRRLVENHVPLDGLFRLIKARQDALPHTAQERNALEVEFHKILQRCRYLRSALRQLSPHDLALRGGEIIELVRRAPGPWLGELQHNLVAWVSENPARNHREPLEQYVREWLYRTKLP